MSKLKKGDKVRYIGHYAHYIETALDDEDNGILNVVEDEDDWGHVEIVVPIQTAVDRSDVELVERPDPTTVFLTELQALLKRFNATIDVDGDELYLDLCIDVDGEYIVYNASNFYTGKQKQIALTPDNIFDYEK